MVKTECVMFESTQIRSLFYLVAAIGSGRSAADMLEANRSGETVDINYDKMTDQRFFAVLALIATEHALQFDRTKSETRTMFLEALDAAFAAVVQQRD